MQRRALLLLLFGFCWAGPVPVPQVFEFDSEDSRRVLGSSVVTSVSVIMDLGNGTKAFFADAAGRPVPRPPALSPVGSPVELLSPDRYEFYTFDEFGDLVRRYMTLDQIQSIIASGDGEVRPLPGQLEDYGPSSGTADVGDVIASVQNVLRGAMNASEEPTTRKPPPPRPTKRPEDIHKTTGPSETPLVVQTTKPMPPVHTVTTRPLITVSDMNTTSPETPSVVKPAKPLPPLHTVMTRPLSTMSGDTATPSVVQLTTDKISSIELPPKPTTAPANAAAVSEITSTSTQSDADSMKTESLGSQSTTTVLPSSAVTVISVEITSSEANETSNGNVAVSSNTSTNETVDSESVQSAVTTENSVQTEQSSTVGVVVNDGSSTTQTSTSVSSDTSYSTSETTTVQTEQSSTVGVVENDGSSTTQTSTSVSSDTSYSTSETTTVSTTQTVYNESSTVSTVQGDSLQNETINNVSVSAESSASNQQESQTSSVENTTESQSYEESSLETTTELSDSGKNETTSTEISETTEYVTEIVSVQTGESSLNASIQNGTDESNSSAMDEITSFDSNSTAVSNTTNNAAGSLDMNTTNPETPLVVKPAMPLPPLHTVTTVSDMNTTNPEAPSVVKPAKPLPPLHKVTTRPLTTVSDMNTPNPEAPTVVKPPKPLPPLHRVTTRPLTAVSDMNTTNSEAPSVVKPAKPLPPLHRVTTRPLSTISVDTATPSVVQLTTDKISSIRLPPTKPKPITENHSVANTTEGEDSSLIMEEILDSTLENTNQDSVEASSTTPQPENFTSSTANVSISQYSAETSSETYSTEISILTQPTESSNKVFNESNSEGSTNVDNVPSTQDDDISPTTQTYSDTTFSEIVSQKVEDNNDTQNDVTTTSSMDSYLPQELIDSLSSVMSQVSEDNDQQNLSGLKFSSENITATTLIPEITETTTILSIMEKFAVNSSSPSEIDVIGETTTVNIETEQTTLVVKPAMPLPPLHTVTTVSDMNTTNPEAPSVVKPAKPLPPLHKVTTRPLTTVSDMNTTNPEAPTVVKPPKPLPPLHRVTTRPLTTVSDISAISESTNPIVNLNENTKQEEITQIDSTTQESSMNYIGGTAAETTTNLSINPDESDSIQPTTVTSETSENESLNISFKSGNANTSSEELSTLVFSDEDFERTTTLRAEAEVNIITTISPLVSNSGGDDIKIFTTESSSGDIQSTTTVPSKSFDYTTITVNDEKYSETEATPEQTTSLSMDLPQTTEIDSLIKLITKGETRISLIEEPGDTTNETSASYETTEAETTTFSTQPDLQETDVTNVTKYNTSEAFSPESKEDSATAGSVTAQDEIETNATAIYSTSTAHPENDTFEAEVETTYVSGTKDENSVSEYDASVKESSQTSNGTDSENSSTFLKNVSNEIGTGTEVNTTSSSQSSTSDQPEDVTTTETLTEQPALKADLQNGYETSIYESGSNSSDVPQNSSSEQSVNESGATVDITTTEASQVVSSTGNTETNGSSNSDVPVQEAEETSSKDSETSSGDGASTEGSTSASASPISLTAPEIEEPGDNALKDGVDALSPVDLRPSQNEHLGLEATTASLERGVRRFADLCNELALRLWAAVAARGATSSRSLVMSPFAVTSLLAMVFLGARGPTSSEMNDLLRLDDMVTFNPHLIFRNITETLVHGRTSGIASVAFVRQLYSDKNKGKLLDFYKDRAQQFYDGHVEEANFRVIGDLVRRRTNLLVKRQTRGRVPEFLRGPGVALRPPLAAFSANVLQTDCSDASMEGRDGEMYFTVTPSPRERRLIPVPAAVWRQGVYAGYDPQIDATVAALGVDSAVSLIFVSPGQQGNVAPGDGLPQLERRLLTPAAWSRLLRSLLPRPGLELQVPRFSHRSLLNATGALHRLGLRDLLTPGRADLRGLDGLGDLHLADVLAATALTTCAGESGHAEAYPARAARLLDADLSDLPLALRPRQARRPPAPARLRYDKPFFYAVRHNPTGVVLHMGRFNPRLQ